MGAWREQGRKRRAKKGLVWSTAKFRGSLREWGTGSSKGAEVEQGKQ